MKNEYTKADYDFYAACDLATKACPKCGATKPLPHFGLRTLNGKVAPQSWCRKCRRTAAAERRAAAK